MQESIYKIEWSLFIAMCENASLQEAAEAYGLSASGGVSRTAQARGLFRCQPL